MHKYTQKTRPEPHKARNLTYIEIDSRDERTIAKIYKKGRQMVVQELVDSIHMEFVAGLWHLAASGAFQ